MSKKYYFVYGTLKEGHGNHRILENCKKVGDFTTEPEFTMIHLGGFPGVLRDGETAIKGELYEVEDESVEARLDRLEGYNPTAPESGLYNKEIININEKDAYIYTFNDSRRDITNYKQIKTGEWL